MPAEIDHEALQVPDSVDEALHSVAVCVGLVVLAKAAFDKVVQDDLAKLLTLVIREPPLCQSVEERKRGRRPARYDLPEEIRFGSGEPLVHDSMSKMIVTGPSLTSSTAIRAPKTPRLDVDAEIPKLLDRTPHRAARPAPAARPL